MKFRFSICEIASSLDEAHMQLYPNSVIIGSSEEEGRLYTTPAVNWISHMPEPTIEALKMRKDKANIYLLGPEKIVSK